MARHLSNWLESWLEFTEPLPAPRILRLWAGLGAVSTALSRRVWLQGNPRMLPCYPNLYIMMVAPPGVGKDVAINKAADCLLGANRYAIKKIGTHLYKPGGESISPKGLIDRMADQTARQIYRYHNGKEQVSVDFHSLAFFVGEATTAIPEYNPLLIAMLNDLFNCKAEYADSIRGNEVIVDKPHLSLILGNQPDTLAEIFPDRTFRMGFTARVFFIFANTPVVRDIFVDEKTEVAWDNQLWSHLQQDLVDMATMAGPLSTTKETRTLINEFNRDRPAPVPGPRFSDWNSRRPLHAQKLAICLSAVESSAGLITPTHWEKALEHLFAAEARMPKIFENVTTSRGFSEVYEEIKQMGKNKDKVRRHTISLKLARTKSPTEVNQIIDTAIADGILVLITDEVGNPVKPTTFRITHG